VEPGKYADLVVIDGDPLRNLRVFQRPENPRLVMKGGRIYKSTL
jgi:imidazolonepropionase-like amidohydrolase